MCGGHVVPSHAPRVICPALISVREEVVGSNKQAISLQADLEGQMGDCRGGMAAIGVVQLDERIEAIFGVDVAFCTPQDLIRRRNRLRLDSFRPAQEVGIMAVRVRGQLGVLSVAAGLPCDVDRRECMTA